MTLQGRTLEGRRLGRWRLGAQIGSGGMGVVHVADDLDTGRRAAVKVAHASLSSDEQARLSSEAQILSRLYHPNIATFFGVADLDGQAAIIMEFVEGEPLSRWMHRRIDDHDAHARIITGLAQALGYLHAQDIVHRDIKPDNVMVTPQGEARLLDFGIARMARQPNLTQTGAVIGSLRYMPPERLRGAPADARSDVWAFGATMYEMLAGHPAFNAHDFADLAEAHADRRLPSALDHNSRAPEVWRRLVRRCLERDPRARPQNGAALVAALQGDPSSPSFSLPAVTLPKLDISALRNPVVVGCGVALATTLAVLGWPRDTRDVQPVAFVGAGTEATPLASGEQPITIFTFTAPFDVAVDGRAIGATPARFTAPIGAHLAVSCRQNGQETYAFTITVGTENDYPCDP